MPPPKARAPSPAAALLARFTFCLALGWRCCWPARAAAAPSSERDGALPCCRSINGDRGLPPPLGPRSRGAAAPSSSCSDAPNDSGALAARATARGDPRGAGTTGEPPGLAGIAADDPGRGAGTGEAGAGICGFCGCCTGGSRARPAPADRPQADTACVRAFVLLAACVRPPALFLYVVRCFWSSGREAKSFPDESSN